MNKLIIKIEKWKVNSVNTLQETGQPGHKKKKNQSQCHKRLVGEGAWGVVLMCSDRPTYSLHSLNCSKIVNCTFHSLHALCMPSTRFDLVFATCQTLDSHSLVWWIINYPPASIFGNFLPASPNISRLGCPTICPSLYALFIPLGISPHASQFW